jgi:hypothetical protein
MQVVLCQLQPHLSLVDILVEPWGRGGGGGPHGAKVYSSVLVLSRSHFAYVCVQHMVCCACWAAQLPAAIRLGGHPCGAFLGRGSNTDVLGERASE